MRIHAKAGGFCWCASRRRPLFAIAMALMGLASSAASAQSNAQIQGENGTGSQAALKATLTYNADLLADGAGGDRPGFMYDGRLGLILNGDLDQLMGWQGATAHLSIHAIHGTGISGDRVGNVLTVSALEARPALRLFNLWIEQKLSSRVTFRLGQFTAAQEFAISPTANLFVNSTFGWPASFAVDLPSGGPAYPLAAPGARLSYSPTPDTTLLVAAFAGDPAGPGAGDPQSREVAGEI